MENNQSYALMCKGYTSVARVMARSKWEAKHKASIKFANIEPNANNWKVLPKLKAGK